jgi:hypothetical protein
MRIVWVFPRKFFWVSIDIILSLPLPIQQGKYAFNPLTCSLENYTTSRLKNP